MFTLFLYAPTQQDTVVLPSANQLQGFGYDRWLSLLDGYDDRILLAQAHIFGGR